MEKELWNKCLLLLYILGILKAIYALIIAFLFAVSLIMGYQLQTRGMMESGFRGKTLVLIRGLCLSVCIFPFTNYLFYGIEKICVDTEEKSIAKVWKSKNVFGQVGVLFFALGTGIFGVLSNQKDQNNKVSF